MQTSHAMDDSARQFNEFGWMTIEGNPITKVGVFPYLGSQIGDADKTRIFMVYRPEEELNNAETIESFKLTPFINEHPQKLLGNVGSLVKTDDKRIEGVFGEKVYFEYPMLRANLRVYSADALDSIDLGKEELSAGYNCQWIKQGGVWVDPQTGESHPYQYVQRRIRGNHGALVVDGRSGPEISVMDHMTFKLDNEEQQMDLAELVKAVAALTEAQSTFHGAMDAKISAIDAKVAAMDSDDDKKDGDGKKKDDAMDEEDDKKDDEKVDDTKAALDAALQRIAILEARPAAMDSGAIIADIARKTDLANRLSQHLGSFACDSMTFEQVAEYGAEKLGLPKDNAAIRVESYLMAKPAPAAYALDSATVAKSTGAAFLAEAFSK
jgi:hypothetical protein